MLGLHGQSGGDKTGFTGYVLHTDNIEETYQTLKPLLGQRIKRCPRKAWVGFC
jgi:hypothetical protein